MPGMIGNAVRCDRMSEQSRRPSLRNIIGQAAMRDFGRCTEPTEAKLDLSRAVTALPGTAMAPPKTCGSSSSRDAQVYAGAAINNLPDDHLADAVLSLACLKRAFSRCATASREPAVCAHEPLHTARSDLALLP